MSLLETYIKTQPEFSRDEIEKAVSLINKFSGYGFISEDERTSYMKLVERKRKEQCIQRRTDFKRKTVFKRNCNVDFRTVPFIIASLKKKHQWRFFLFCVKALEKIRKQLIKYLLVYFNIFSYNNKVIFPWGKVNCHIILTKLTRFQSEAGMKVKKKREDRYVRYK